MPLELRSGGGGGAGQQSGRMREQYDRPYLGEAALFSPNGELAIPRSRQTILTALYRDAASLRPPSYWETPPSAMTYLKT